LIEPSSEKNFQTMTSETMTEMTITHDDLHWTRNDVLTDQDLHPGLRVESDGNIVSITPCTP